MMRVAILDLGAMRARTGGAPRRLAPAVVLLLILSGPAPAAPGRDPSRAAQDVALARLAPTVCDDVVTDARAVTVFMARARIGEGDLTGRYAGAVRATVQTFQHAVDDDEDAACSRLVRRLGQEGLGIVDEAGMGAH